MVELLKQNERLFYSKDGIIVRDSQLKDVLPLSNNLRQGDIDEIWASHHLRSLDALVKSYNCSLTCLTGLINEVPFSMFGCTPVEFVGTKGLIWMLATEELYTVRLEFLRYSRHFVDILLQDYPILFNYVDARNVKSIIWLKRIGAEIKEAKPHGVDGLPFHYFSFKRS